MAAATTKIAEAVSAAKARVSSEAKARVREEKRQCDQCKKTKAKSDVTKEQVKKHRAVCRECKAKARAMHEERRCANCTKRKAKSEFRGEQLKKQHAVCEECEAKARSKREGGLKCDACGKHRARKEFSVREEEKRGRKKCKAHEARQE